MSKFNHANTNSVVVTFGSRGETALHTGVDGFHFDDFENLVITNGEKVAAIYARNMWRSIVVKVPSND